MASPCLIDTINRNIFQKREEVVKRNLSKISRNTMRKIVKIMQTIREMKNAACCLVGFEFVSLFH